MTTTGNNTNATSSSSSSSDDESESGWTLYLEQSTQFLSTTREKNADDDLSFYDYVDYDNDVNKEEEDLSMVSDASSGPPHLEEEEEEEEVERRHCDGGRKRGAQIRCNVKLGRRRFDGHDFALDDTASSHPFLNVILSSKEKGGTHCVENQASSVKSVIDYSSQGFSATHYQVVVETRKKT